MSGNGRPFQLGDRQTVCGSSSALPSRAAANVRFTDVERPVFRKRKCSLRVTKRSGGGRDPQARSVISKLDRPLVLPCMGGVPVATRSPCETSHIRP